MTAQWTVAPDAGAAERRVTLIALREACSNATHHHFLAPSSGRCRQGKVVGSPRDTNSMVAYVREGHRWSSATVRRRLVPSGCRLPKTHRFVAARRTAALPEGPNGCSVKRFMGRGIDDFKNEAQSCPSRRGEPGEWAHRVGTASCSPPRLVVRSQGAERRAEEPSEQAFHSSRPRCHPRAAYLTTRSARYPGRGRLAGLGCADHNERRRVLAYGLTAYGARSRLRPFAGTSTSRTARRNRRVSCAGHWRDHTGARRHRPHATGMACLSCACGVARVIGRGCPAIRKA